MIVTVIAILVVGGFVQGSTGSGFGVLTAPVLLLIAPHLVPGPLLWLAAAVCAAGAWAERAHIDRGFVGRAVLAAIPGSAVGFVALRFVDPDVLMTVIAVVVMASGFLGCAGVGVRATGRTAVAAGFCSGALNYAAALPGPALALAYRTPDAAQMRSTLSTVFAVMSAATACAVIVVGGGHVGDIATAAALSVPVALGAIAARAVAHRLTSSTVARAGMVLSIVAGVGLLMAHV